ncbi:MAG: SurA N-terminal domain-containing protein [Candidatus Omnitrophota bacterium]|nr:SurA N-terminal domain-containing protein [Candidatus Omnitrophota bacterium]
MLNKLRNKKTARKIWITLAVIIVPAFIFWGFGGAVRSREETRVAGRISGKAITSQEYRDAMDAVKNQAMMQFGESFEEVKKYLNLETQAWQRLVLLSEAKKRGINASDNEVIAYVEKFPLFTRQGRFDKRLYTQVIQYEFRAQPRVFEEQVRQNIILSKLYKQATDSIRVNEEEIKNEYNKANEQMSLDYIAALPADFATGINPGEAELKDYFAKNSLDFKQPMSFNADYVESDSEEKIRSFLLKSKKSGFEGAAKGLKLNLKSTGLFAQTDFIPGIGWSPEIISLLGRLNTGQSSPPVKIDKNFYAFKLKEKKEPYIPEFEKVKVRVRESFIREASAKTAQAKLQDCLQELNALSKEGKSPDFSKPAKSRGLKSNSTGLFKYGSYIEGIGASDKFWDAASELGENAYSSIINTPSGFYIVKLKEKVAVDEKKFAAEKEAFSRDLLERKKQEAFTKFTEGLLKKTQL